MKILIIIGGFFPGKKFGGPPVSVDNFCKLLRDDECYIYTYNHEMGTLEPYSGILTDTWINRNSYQIKYVNQSDYCKKEFERAIREIRPDMIYLQGLFQSCILPCLELAKKMNLKVLLAPRGELCSGAFKKRYKKVLYILYLKLKGLLKNVYYQSTSDEETESIKRILGASREKIFFLTNIPSIPSNQYKRQGKESGKANFIFLARIHPKKNLISAIKYFMSVTGEVSFDIYGSIEDQEYWFSCQKEIEKLPENIKVSYRGLLSHEEVHNIFSRYDAFVFPTFSENYGHVIAESLVVGTPVIISDQTPWTDVNQYKAGWALPLSEEAAFVSAIQEIVNCSHDRYFKNAQKYAEKKMNLEIIRKEYEAALKSILS